MQNCLLSDPIALTESPKYLGGPTVTGLSRRLAPRPAVRKAAAAGMPVSRADIGPLAHWLNDSNKQVPELLYASVYLCGEQRLAPQAVGGAKEVTELK